MLQENFRSRAGVLNAANLVFKNIMSKRLGEIDYDQNAYLKPGADYPPEDCPAELIMLRLPEGADDEESPDKTELEADMVAARINYLVNSGVQVLDSGAMRPVGYGDIAVLLRSPGSSGQVYRRALEARGIPVMSEQGGGFFASLEVSSMISFLSVIDNPHQDIPLISALRSPISGLTPTSSGESGRDKGRGFFRRS
jgi:ATP-dependent helicase/nuclease subunit A